jgi:hypothetical protein
MHIGAKVVNPELFGPGFASAGPVVKKERVCFYTLGIEDAGRKSQEVMDVAVMQQAFPYDFSGSAFEENVVRKDNCGLS